MTPSATTRQYGAVCTAVNRNQKNTGWALKLAARPNMKFEDTFYINDKEPLSEQVQHDLLGQYVTLTLERGNLKDGKTGEYGPWDYWENVRDIKVGEAPAPAPVPTGRDAGSQDEYRRSKEEMRWTEALGLATHWCATLWAQEHPAGYEDREWILETAAWYYAAIVPGPPQGQAQDGAPEAVAPPQAPERPRTPAQTPQGQQQAPSAIADPWAFIAAGLAEYNDHVKATRQGRVLQWERDVLPRVQYKFGDNPTPEQALVARAAIVQGSIPTWPTGERRAEVRT